MNLKDYLVDITRLVQVEKEITEVKPSREQGYARLSFDLGTARTNEEVSIRGKCVAILDYDGSETGTSFRINSRNAPLLYPSEIRSFPMLTDKIYLTNEAQTGKTLVLLVSATPFGPSGARHVVQTIGGGDLATEASLIDGRDGSIFSGSITMTDDNATQIDSDTTLLMYILLQCKTHPLTMGSSTSQDLLLAVDDVVGVEYTKLSELYVKNTGAGNNGKLIWFGKG